MCGMVGLEVIQSPLREWEGAGRIGRGQGWGSGCKFFRVQRPQSILSPLREWEGAGRIGRGQGWGSGCKFMGEQRPQNISKPPPGVGGGRPNRPGAGVGIGILAERCHTAAEHFKAPSGSGRGQAEQAGGRGGDWDFGGAVSWVFKPPPGVGGGRPNRPGAGVGTGLPVTHVSRMKAPATRPLFARYEQKGGSGADAERRGTIIIL